MARVNQANGMLTVRQVARILNVHINTVRRWSTQGRLKVYRIGSRGDRRFRQDDVTSFLSGQTNDGDSLPVEKAIRR